MIHLIISSFVLLLFVFYLDIGIKCVNCPFESHPENSGHPVRYYCRCQCLGSSHMVIVHLVLQPSLCGIDCRQILEMPRLLKILNNYYLLNHYRVFTDILFGVLLYYILFVQRL